MKILCCYDVDWQKECIKKKLPSNEFVFVQGTIRNSTHVPDAHIEALCIFIDSPITAEVFDRYKNLKYIATRSTGFDHIDLALAKKRGVFVSTVPAYGAHTVAEYTLGLILCLSRRLPQACKLTQQGVFSQPLLTGFDLHGQTLGIVGTGAIGAQVARIAKAFGMRIIAHDIAPKKQLIDGCNVLYVPLNELIAQATIITLHVCYNEKTHHLIDREQFNRMRRGTYLINTSRGPVVNTIALIEALKSGIIGGAALDVYEEEAALADTIATIVGKPEAQQLQTILATRYLVQHPQVIATPHNAFNSIQALEYIWDITAQNIQAFIDGKPTNLAQCPG